ncbi:MAG: ATP-binding cassette domain-containing protein [Clostridiales bacterium]|nr:ATP-binding cassette domain-containing protein [Clostridiales bacterium]
MIEVINLSKSFGDKHAVRDINFTINSGEVVGFLGPNGAGKTTTMNIITGYLSATAGTVKVHGIDVLEDPIAAKRYIGYLPEHPPLYMDMTVNEYLSFAYDLKRVKGISKKKHINEICDSVSITHVRDRMVKNLSKGYKQRVGLAMSLIGNPDVLILDEPTVGLDPIQIIEIRNVIKELGRDRTVILSSHILPEVQAICERVLVINNGVIVANDTPENLSASISGEHKLSVRIAGPADAVQNTLRACEGIRTADMSLEHEDGSCEFVVEADPNVDVRKPMFFALAKAGYPILMLKPLDMSLEDIFLKLTTEEN